VLIIDDHPDTLATIGELVSDEGHAHHEVSNGQEALSWLERQAELPCLILLDLRMPVMDGWDFLRAMRTLPRLAEIPVIVISVTISAGDPPVLPAKAFWSKPPDAQQISSLHLFCDRHRDSWKPKPLDVS
jgi:two-component system chemotaxis response regulator CheY